ncbi:MAG: hypothetical protein HFF39_06945 [Lawsonibacter sp.]|nr:hypothetical protein [Lawsonibacter sp.]
MDTVTKEPKAAAVEPSEKGYQLTIGRDTIRVVSVFSGTKTASEAIYEAAVKKRVSTHKEHFDISEGSNSLVQQRHAVTSFTGEIPGKN